MAAKDVGQEAIIRDILYGGALAVTSRVFVC